MRTLVSLLINPVLILYVLLIISSVLLLYKRKRAGKTIVSLALFWFIIISTPFLPTYMIKSLESKYSQITDSTIAKIKGPCDIIILGGGHTDDKKLTPNNQLTLQAQSRLVEGIRIHRLIPGSRIILSGSQGRSEVPQAIVLYRTALLLGIDSSSMSIQTIPSNTRQEAVEYVKNFGTKNNLILVTSANHMKRAVMLFQNAGLNPTASPTDFILKYGSQKRYFRIIPDSTYIGMLESSLHEYIGILWAYFGGK
ncbi:MAG: YdcF family protein [Bacteroidia bacterium]|nr:YdcF family protein [Bacteroidia bacterium]